MKPPKKPAARPDDRRETQADHGRGAGDQQRVAPAIEQPRHDVAALVVGAEEIGAEIPGRPDGRVAEAQPFGRLLHHRHLLAIDDDDGVEGGAERVDAGIGGIDRRQQAQRRRSG